MVDGFNKDRALQQETGDRFLFENISFPFAMISDHFLPLEIFYTAQHHAGGSVVFRRKIKRPDHDQVKTPIFMGSFSEHLQLKVSPPRFIQTRKHAEGRGEPSVFDHLG